jgi:hypothetical protein
VANHQLEAKSRFAISCELKLFANSGVDHEHIFWGLSFYFVPRKAQKSALKKDGEDGTNPNNVQRDGIFRSKGNRSE